MAADLLPDADVLAILANASRLGFPLWRVAPALDVSPDALRRIEPRVRGAAEADGLDAPSRMVDQD